MWNVMCGSFVWILFHMFYSCVLGKLKHPVAMSQVLQNNYEKKTYIQYIAHIIIHTLWFVLIRWRRTSSRHILFCSPLVVIETDCIIVIIDGTALMWIPIQSPYIYKGQSWSIQLSDSTKSVCDHTCIARQWN